MFAFVLWQRIDLEKSFVNMMTCTPRTSTTLLVPSYGQTVPRRWSVRARAVYDYDRAEKARLESTDAFKELVAISGAKQSVNKPHKVCSSFLRPADALLL